MTDDQTPAEELRAAAQRLRTLAEAATPGPWQTTGKYGYTLATANGDRIATFDLSPAEAVLDDDTANAWYAAAMHPGVALALADLLDAIGFAMADEGRTQIGSSIENYADDVARLVLEAK
jgi:hypothetical protein